MPANASLLRDELHLPIPPVHEPLDEIDHPLLIKASEQFGGQAIRHERIRAVDDTVLFKVKVGRWRGAVWEEPEQPWLVAAGWREQGSGDDFYASLAAEGKAARVRYNTDHRPPLSTGTYTVHLLPAAEDRERYAMEAAIRLVRRLRAVIRDLVRASLRDGHEHVSQLETLGIAIQVRADDGYDTYVAIRVTGSVPRNLAGTILELVPGCDPDGWMFELVLPNRPLFPGEQVWSNIMDPKEAARLLDAE